MAEELSLESLARRVERLERLLQAENAPARKKDWRRVVGIGDGSETMKQIIAEGEKIRRADREVADQ